MKFILLLFLLCFVPLCYAVVDYTQFLTGLSFKVSQNKGQPQVRVRNWGETYFITDSQHQDGILHIINLDRIYGEITYSVLSEAIGLPNNAKYPVFVKRNENGLLPNSSQNIILAMYEPREVYTENSTSLSDGKLISELLMHSALLYLFGAEQTQMEWNSRQFPIRITSGEKSYRNRKSFKEEFFTLAYLPTLKTQTPTQLLETLLQYKLNQQLFTSTTQKEIIHFLNTYISYLESIPEAEIKSLMAPLNTILKKSVAGPFLERRSHLRDLFYQFFEGLKFHAEYLQDLKKPLLLKTLPNILLPERDLPQTLETVRNYPLKTLWTIFFEPQEAERRTLIKSLSNLMNTKNPIETLQDIASRSGENFYHVTPYLSQRTVLYEHQTQLNAHRYKTLVVTPFNDVEAKTIYNLARKLGSETFIMNVPHGHYISIKDADLIISKARDLKLKTILLVELPSKSDSVENHIRMQGFEVVIIDHHSHGVDIDRVHRLSSLEQFANYFNYKLSPREYLVGLMDRSFIYGFLDVRLNQQEILEVLRTMGHEDYQQLIKNLDIFLKAPKIPYTLPNGDIVFIYLVENKYAKLAQVTQAAAILEFPEIANILIINRRAHMRDTTQSILFSGRKEIADLLKKDFFKLKNYPNQFSGGNQRTTGYWGVEVESKNFKNKLSPILKRVYELLKVNTEQLKDLQPEDKDKIESKKRNVLESLYAPLNLTTRCQAYFISNLK